MLFNSVPIHARDGERTEKQWLSWFYPTPTESFSYNFSTFDFRRGEESLTSGKLKLASDCISYSESLCLHYAAVRPRATHSWISSAPVVLQKNHRLTSQQETLFKELAKAFEHNTKSVTQCLKCQPVSCVYILTEFNLKRLMALREHSAVI